MQVCLTNGELTVFWTNQDTHVADLKGQWRGPIPPLLNQGADRRFDPTAYPCLLAADERNPVENNMTKDS